MVQVGRLRKCALYKGGKELLHGMNLLLIRVSAAILPDLIALFLTYLRTRGYFIQIAQHAVNQSSLNQSKINQIPIPLPPLAEQRRIVAKIEELFSELDAGEESLRRARRQLGVYRQSLLKQAFEGKLTEPWRKQNPEAHEWNFMPLESVVDFTNGFAFKSKEYNEDGIPVVRISDISVSGVSLDHCARIRECSTVDRFQLQQWDILIAMSGATTGKFGQLKSAQKCYQNQRVGCFRTKNENVVSQSFLLQLLEGLKRRIEKDAYGGAQPNISGKQINAYEIPVPCPSEQQEIVRLLDEQFTVIEQNEREIDAALKRSAALRQSILKNGLHRPASSPKTPRRTRRHPAGAHPGRTRKRLSASQIGQKDRGEQKGPEGLNFKNFTCR